MDDPAPGPTTDPVAIQGPIAHTVTLRLELLKPRPSDCADLFQLYSHPQVWAPDPLTRHEDVAQTERMITAWQAAWRRDGLGIWVARARSSTETGRLVGIGGCFVRHGVAWNLGFRLMPEHWGQGLAQEMNAAALASARHLRPDLPVTAYLLEGNQRSQRTTERAGLQLVWRGHDAGNPDDRATRLLYSDQDVPDQTIKILTDT